MISKNSLKLSLLFITTYISVINNAYGNDLPFGKDKSCGPRCLAALVKLTGGQKLYQDIDPIYKLIGKPSGSPTSMLEIQKAARLLGFNVNCYKLSIDELKQSNNCAIVPVGITEGTSIAPLHFVLLKEIKDDTVICVDSYRLTELKLSIVEFKKVWSGYAIVLPGVDLKTVGKSSSQNHIKHETTPYEEIKVFDNANHGDKIEHSFVLSEELTSGALTRIVGKNCSCLDAEIVNISSNKKELKLVMSVNKPGWQEAYAAVEFKPANIIKKYAIRVFGQNSHIISPTIGYVELDKDSTIQYPIKIECYLDKDSTIQYKGFVPSITGISCTLPNVTEIIQENFKKVIIEPILLIDGTQIHGLDTFCLKEHKFILIQNNVTKEIPFKLKIEREKEEYRITPSKVFIIASDESIPGDANKISVDLSSYTSPINSIKIKCNMPLYFVVIRKKESNLFAINMEMQSNLAEKMTAGLNRGLITIETEPFLQSNEKINIPVSIFIR